MIAPIKGERSAKGLATRKENAPSPFIWNTKEQTVFSKDNQFVSKQYKAQLAIAVANLNKRDSKVHINLKKAS